MASIQDPHQPPSGQSHPGTYPQPTQQQQQQLSAAQRAVAAGDWLSAARQLQQAAQRASSDGRARQAAHCEQMAASLLRAGGSLDEALAAADRVVARDPASPAARFAAEAERAQTLQAQGDDSGASQAWRQSLDAAEMLSLPDWARATVLRSLAGSEVRGGAFDSAWIHFDEAATLMSDDLAAPAWVDVEQAQAARGIGQLAHARDVLGRARVQARLDIDPHLRAEVQRTLAECVLDECALDDGDADQAREAARLAHLAREAALEAVAPLSYFAAAVALARAADLRGDRTEAYRVTASAWVTLADLLGQDLARSWMEPVLLGFKLRWGDDAFAEARAAHERQRRDALRRTD
ncbi:hypothetical protein [Mitsuaria sp. 7]|uniref:hypothetical protein n=1 Tax=Mitsuaria sp. 7 TaxID=1658665 RepID=UPI0007DD6F8C|nr:hypothetical protein [Mitsuaria sp. 7]ANH68307.1 hypothetical protein ABE85_13360 [Mitsuaria sp. 7]